MRGLVRFLCVRAFVRCLDGLLVEDTLFLLFLVVGVCGSFPSSQQESEGMESDRTGQDALG